MALLVALPRFSLPVESAGSFAAIGGTYIIVKLDLPPPFTPTNYALSVTFNGVNSTNTPTITIIP